MRAILAAIVGIGVLYGATDGFRAVTAEGARRLSVERAPRPLPELALETMTRRQMTLHPLRSEAVLVEFIYTSCPVICQAAGADFARLRDRLRADGVPVRMLSISFDPERDDPEALAAYGERHGADGEVWTVARPAADRLPELLQAFGVTVIADGWGGYEHNAAIHLIDPLGRFSGLFDTDALDEVASALGR